MEYTVEQNGDLLIIRTSGEAEKSVMRAYITDVVRHVHEEDARFVLIDHSRLQTTSEPLKGQDLRGFSRFLKHRIDSSRKRLPRPLPVAVVAGNQLTFGNSRMVEAFAQLDEINTEVRTFSDKEEALDWLNSKRA